MTGLNRDQRQEAVDQMLANWKIEGFEPDDEYLAELSRYVAGEITLRDVALKVEERRGRKG